MNKQELTDLVGKLRERYHQQVKPFIDQGLFGPARGQMADIIFLMEEHRKDITFGIRSGGNYIEFGKNLYEELAKDSACLEDVMIAVGLFEPFQAQTRLLKLP